MHLKKKKFTYKETSKEFVLFNNTFSKIFTERKHFYFFFVATTLAFAIDDSTST